MKILMLVNWKVKYCDAKPDDRQPPDYKIEGEDYWFYRYFKKKPEVDVIDITSFPLLENFEKNKLHFYIWQAIKAIPKLNQYDLVVSHGMPSAVVICLWRKFFKTKAKHIVFDIGSFASASESGLSLKLMQFASRSLDGLIYHMKSQRTYYERFFPWISGISFFVHYGADCDYFKDTECVCTSTQYMVCAGRSHSDWETLVNAYKRLGTHTVELHLIGEICDQYIGIDGVIQKPYLSTGDYKKEIEGALLCVLPLDPLKYSFGQMRLLQQMAMGKCVVAARIPSLVDYATDGENILFYKPGDTDDCARTLYKALNSRALREYIEGNAKNHVLNNLNEQNMAQKIEKVYEKVDNCEGKK